MKSLKPITCGKFVLNFEKPLLMGILNVTPDSFSDGGVLRNVQAAVEHGLKIAREGADIIDVGGESTRPGSEPVKTEDELERVLHVVGRLAQEVDIPISIDSTKPEVAEACVNAGASLINDISGLRMKGMIDVASRHKVPVIIMHMKGTPKTMQQNPQYRDVVEEILDFLRDRVQKARDAGIDTIVDPGIGFGKSTHHNLEILLKLNEFRTLGVPVLVSPSRKSFIGDITGLGVNDRLEGTIAAVCIAAMKGANILRIHDVQANKRALMIIDAMNSLSKR